ncbi:DUF2313 domain-containing protein [Gilliamella sp. B2969]|uniref:YmfQ family protein n=1 Tax=Gilliamella sp. B2969 TaxID=2818021 RepID=UPI00226A79E6|nr:putative phage tail protein [Gilliamella sp. B2969]MCX8729583.1 DUF2313 domain-containing protein [Gilliamella sp. B2969]
MDIEKQYQSMVGNLLPYGPAWDKTEPILLSLALTLSKTHLRIDDLMREIDPCTTTELIDRYEQICGLPDSCYSEQFQTLTTRRNRLDSKLNLTGGINKDFYLQILAINGFPDATITNYNNDVFTCESSCEDHLYDEEWRYYWIVNIPHNYQITEMTCEDSCDSYLRTWGDKQIECIIEKLCPSHTHVIFKYGVINA